MGAETLAGMLLALLMVAPFLIERYLSHLPVAPACPACRTVTRELVNGWLFTLPLLASTILAECGRCGWSGRMRWTLAPDVSRRDRNR